MEKKLYDASLKGDVEALEALMREDELILARVSISSCFNQTPLHLASMLGHFEFAKSLLSYKPEFVKRLDSQGRSPLHLASANGYANIVRLLLEKDSNLCHVRDEDGRTPLHLAVMNGQHESAKELIKVNSELSFHDEEEKLLHLCVTYNRLNILIHIIESMDKDLSHIKDANGNTILHSAATLKRIEMVKYLVSRSDVDVYGVNGNDLTALNIIDQMPIDAKTMEIKELLISAPAYRAKQKEAAVATTKSNSNFKIINMWNKVRIFGKEKEMKDESLLVAASVIASIAYTSAITPPGGAAAQDAVEYAKNAPSAYDKYYDIEPGTSLLGYFYPGLNRYFWISNTIAFIASLSVLFLFVSGASLKRKFFIWILRLAMWITIAAMGFAYVCAAEFITPSDRTDIFKAISVTLYVWMGFIGLSFYVVVIKFITYTVRSVKRIREESAKKEVKHTGDPSVKNITSGDAANSQSQQDTYIVLNN